MSAYDPVPDQSARVARLIRLPGFFDEDVGRTSWPPDWAWTSEAREQTRQRAGRKEASRGAETINPPFDG